MSHLEVAKKYVEALGGLDNIKSIDNCITRLRLEIHDMEKVNEDKIIEIGSMGTVYVGKNKLHLIIGAQVVMIADEMHKLKGDHLISQSNDTHESYHEMAKNYIITLGGSANIEKIDNCITRLRITVKDMQKIDENTMSTLGNRGIIHKSNNELHIVVGMIVTNIASIMRNMQHSS